MTFPTAHDITKVTMQKETTYFDINGSPASRQQFLLQNAFALTVHKTQGWTLPCATVSVDENMFAPGQVYVAMSRVPSWESLDILDFDFSCVKTDRSVIQEYTRPRSVNQRGLNQIMSLLWQKSGVIIIIMIIIKFHEKISTILPFGHSYP